MVVCGGWNELGDRVSGNSVVAMGTGAHAYQMKGVRKLHDCRHTSGDQGCI